MNFPYDDKFSKLVIKMQYCNNFIIALLKNEV
jgi:hypothetical protein